ncbi:MAG: glycosyltransferase [bacterium]|nr:glycosyltransferase [bacterium]
MNVYRNIDRTKVQFDFLYSFDGVYKDEILALGGKIYKIPFITEKGPFVYRKCVTQFFKTHPEYKIVHSHMDKFSGEIMECAKKRGIPVRIAHSHSIKNEGGLSFQIVKNYYGHKIMPNCTDKFTCSEEAGRWLFSCDKNEFTVVKNGIDTEKFAKCDNRDKNRFTVVNVARFTEQKNHTFLIDAFCELKKLDGSARLILAGEGALQEKIKEKTKRLGLTDSVTFLGDCNDVPRLLSKADAFCMPSLFEGLGIVLIEAQSCGVPCVASDTVPREADITGEVTFLSLADSPKKWAEELLKYKGREKTDNRQKIADAGYDIHTTADFLQNFYLERS